MKNINESEGQTIQGCIPQGHTDYKHMRYIEKHSICHKLNSKSMFSFGFEFIFLKQMLVYLCLAFYGCFLSIFIEIICDL